MAESKLESLVSRLEKVVSQLESTGGAPRQVAAGSNLPSLSDFNELLTDFEQQGNKLDLIELHEMVKNIFVFILVKNHRPNYAAMLLEP